MVTSRVGKVASASSLIKKNLLLLRRRRSRPAAGSARRSVGRGWMSVGKLGATRLQRVAPGLSTRSLATSTLCPHGVRPLPNRKTLPTPLISPFSPGPGAKARALDLAPTIPKTIPDSPRCSPLMRVFDQPSTVGPACLLAALYALIAPYDETFAILLYLADVLIEQVRLQGPALEQGADRATDDADRCTPGQRLDGKTTPGVGALHGGLRGPEYAGDGFDHNSGHPSNRPRHLTRNRLITQAFHWLILQLCLVLVGFMIKAAGDESGSPSPPFLREDIF
jgi:hypothetical protein